MRSSTVAEVGSSTVSALPPGRDYGFVQAATVAAALFEFEPAETVEGPIAVRIGYTYRFKLPPKPPPPLLVATDTATAVKTAPGPGIVNFMGVARESGTRARIPGAVVTVFQGTGAEATGYEAYTDHAGEFVFRDVQPGTWKVLAEASGYYPLRTSEEVVAGEMLEVTYYLEKGSYNPYDVIVQAERPKKEVNRRTLQTAEIVKVAGTLGDPILVVENLPGVARTPGGGQIIVRGSAPEDTRVFVESIDVPLIYHFGGLRSVVPSDMIDSIDFYPGNFSVYYGRGMGGVIDARLKRLEPDQLHGSLDVSLLDASLYLTTPIGEDFAIAVAGRRSYVDFILNAVIPEDSSINLIAAPRYYDYQILANWRPTPAHTVRFFFFGSDDQLELLFEDPAELDAQIESGSLETEMLFNRVAVDYRFAPHTRFRNHLLLVAGRDIISFSLFEAFAFNIDNRQFQLREIASYEVAAGMVLSAGLDAQMNIADWTIRAPRPPKEGDVGFNPDITDVIVSESSLTTYLFAPFLEAELTFGALSLVPGLRLDYFEQIDAFTIDPRIVARYELNDQWTPKAGIGVVHQAPMPEESDPDFGNPAVGPQRAIQYSVGAEWQPLEYLLVDATLFYKDMDNLISRSSATVERDGELVPEVYNNEGRGRVYGLELYVRHDFTNNFHGWLSYTLSRAERIGSGETEARLFTFDQTHIFALVASYVFRENWELGIRWRFVTGNPYTPLVSGVFLSTTIGILRCPRGEFRATAHVPSTRRPHREALDL